MAATDAGRGAGGARQPQAGPLYSAPARLVSLLAAGAVSLLLILYPQPVLQGGQAPPHSALTLLMWGVAAGFVHGVGFVPHNNILRLALGPLVAWLLMPTGMLWLAAG